jgi:hypothetical protein
MPPIPAIARAPEPARALLGAYRAWLSSRGLGNHNFEQGARWFLVRWPAPHAWAEEPLAVRLAAGGNVRPLLSFLMLHGHLRPGYDYLLERKLPALLRELPASPLGPEVDRFLAAAHELGYATRPRVGMATQVTARLLIQTGRELLALTQADLEAFQAAISQREQRHDRAFKHYHTALYATRAVLYHLGAKVEPSRKNTPPEWSWQARLTGVPEPLRRLLVAYLECCIGTRTPPDSVSDGQPPGLLRPRPGRGRP